MLVAPVGVCYVDIETEEEAGHAASAYNSLLFFGSKLNVHTWQQPMKLMGASWDIGRKRCHFSGRDQGSAVGTRFEEVLSGLVPTLRNGLFMNTTNTFVGTRTTLPPNDTW
jgi:hypothetical protein